ncbi:MAG: hypothetical protein ACFUZC_08635 [Chthoniobacteraceae bacterium]
MNTSTRYFLATLGLILFAAATHLEAGDRAAAKSTPPQKHTTVYKITKNAITVSNGTVTKNFKINTRTQFTYQGMSASLSDIQPGMRVTVVPSFNNNAYASEILASDAPLTKK